MAQLKSTNVLGNLAISGNTLSSKFIKLGGTNSELLRADGSAAMLSSAEISQVLGYTPAGNTGANASGTWGISISGNAATATTCTGNAATATTADNAKNGIYYVIGNTEGTEGTWTGSNTNIPSLFTGLTIAYKIGIKGASTTTLTLTTAAGTSGAKTVKRNDGALTTHIPVNSVIHLTYDGTYWRWADYDTTSGKVRQYETTTNANYPLIARYTTNDTTSTSLTEYLRYAQAVTLNPSTGTITAAAFDGALSYSNLTDVPSTFTPPLATSGVRGGMKIGFTATENNRPVLLSSEKAYISLPTRLVDYRTTGTAPDSATASGFYYIANLPASLGFENNQGTMFVSSYSTDWVAQMVIGCYTDKLAFRKKGTAWTNWKIVATEDQLSSYLPLAGGTMTGIITSSYNSGTWINSVNHKSAINLTGTSYVGWINGPSKNGRLVISSYPNSNDRLYFGYASNTTITAGTNALDNSMSWEGSSGTLFAKKFAMAQGDNGKAAWQYNSATDCIELTWY